MQVFDDNQQRRQSEAAFYDRADSVKNLPSQLLGLEMPQGAVGVAQPKHMVEQRNELPRLIVFQTKLRQESGKLRPHFDRRVVQHHARGAADDRSDGPIGLFAQRRTGRMSHRNVLEALLVANAGDEFVDQARFPNSSLANQADELRGAGTR